MIWIRRTSRGRGTLAEQSDCLKPDEMVALVGGALSDEMFEIASAHVDSCTKCQEAAVSIGQQKQYSIDVPPQALPYDRESECIEAVKRIRAMGATGESDTFPETMTQTWDGSTVDENEEMPEMLGRYRPVRRLGRGGMGTVYLAEDMQLDRMVAIKVPQFNDPSNSKGSIGRFYREARAMATIRHPNLCPIYDVGEHQGRPFLAMAYIDGPTLSERLKDDGPMEFKESVQLVHTLLLAIDAIHNSGVVHRDLKPSNVMLEGTRPLITDFGLAARDRADEEELTESGAIIGTPQYMAPEQVRAIPEAIGPHTDVYAIGAMLYQLLTGSRPFEGSRLEILGKIACGNSPAPFPESLQIDPQLERICFQSLAFDAKDRFRSAADFATALEPFLENAPRDSATTPMMPEHSGATGGRIAGVIAMVCVVASVLWINRPDLTTTPGPQARANPAPGEEEVAPATPPLLPTPSHPTSTSTGRLIADDQVFEKSGTCRAVTADFDNDDDMDVLVVNELPEQPNEMWANDGSGRFTLAQQFGSDIPCYKAVVGDLDADGDMDAVILGGPGSESSSIWLNDGAGGLTLHDNRLDEASLCYAALGDVDDDGDLDILTNTESVTQIWKNRGPAEFTSQKIRGQRRADVALGDLDGDDDLDAFLAVHSGPSEVWVNENGTFINSGQVIGTGDMQVVDTELVDADGDGDVDAFIACENQFNSLYVNGGDGKFVGSIRQGSWERGTNSVTPGDFNGDGRMDFLVSNGRDGFAEPNELFFSSEIGYMFHYFDLGATTSAAVADFDGDGDLDAFTATGGNLPNRLLLNLDQDRDAESTYAYRWKDSGQSLSSDASVEVMLEDLDLDGDRDAFVSNYRNPDLVWWNDGKGVFTDSGQRHEHSSSLHAAMADLDGDNDLDVFVPNGSNQRNHVLINDGKGVFRTGQNGIGRERSSSTMVALGDIDGDKDLDAIVANYTGETGIRIWHNQGDATFVDSDLWLGQVTANGIAVADFDRDGDQDLFVLFGGEVPSRIYLNDQGQFQESDQIFSGSGAGPPAVGDVDDDGDLDLIVPRNGPNELWRNDGEGNFTLDLQQFEAMQSWCANLVDLDGDGDLDVVFGNQGPISLWFNDGSGSYSGVQWIGSMREKKMVKCIGVADLNGDDLADLFIAITGHGDRVYFQQPRQ